MRRSTLLVLAPLAAMSLARCGCERPPPAIVLHAPTDPSAGLDYALTDLERLLAATTLGAPTRASLPAPACEDGVVRLLVLGHAHDESGAAYPNPLGTQQFRITDTRCGTDGRRVILEGGSLLAGQWPVYQLLESLGVRFFHPEQTYVPADARWPDTDLSMLSTPWFPIRTLGVHRTHPVELRPPLDLADLDLAAHQRRWIDWNVALRATDVNGYDHALVGRYAHDRGFPRTSGMNLLNTQQGGRPVLDPDDPRPEEEQLREAIDAVMAPVEGLPDVHELGFEFNPSEFTEADPERTVARLTFIADELAARWPDVELITINHGTAQPARPPYDLRFFDLPALAPPNLGVKVHTLMFYDLGRPAPVYGNADFRHLHGFIREQAAKRRIRHYPESSWWLTFDLPVPLFLAPVTLEARQHDLDLLRDLVVSDPASATGVVGHQLFTSGQEWGYWLVDYCVMRMTFDAAVTHGACLDDFTSRLAGAETLRLALRNTEQRQITDLRDPELLRYLVGSDDETEAAELAGIVFHPLPPAPSEVLGWSDDQITTLISTLDRLRTMAAGYRADAELVESVLPAQDAAQAPWVRELRDGLRAFELRAAHSVEVYATAIALRAALRAGDVAGIDRAYEGVDRSRALTGQARAVVRAREADYRYPPALTIAGDEPGEPGAIPNGTVYPYRYLSRTHRLFYWQRPDLQLGALFGEGLDLVVPAARMLERGTALEIRLLAEEVTALRLDRGDGTVSDRNEPYTYESSGIHAWTLDATHARGALHHEDAIAVVDRRFAFPKGSLRVEEPGGAALLQGLLPGFEIGLGTDAAGELLALGRIDGAENISTRGTLQRRARSGDVSGPADLALTLAKVGDVVVRDAELRVDATGPKPRLGIQGRVATEEIIGLLVATGGFDHEGARKIVADILGTTADELAEFVPFRISAESR